MLDDSIVFQNLHKVTRRETELLKRFSEATVRSFSLVHAIRGANQEEPSVNCRKHILKLPARNGDQKRRKCVRLTME